jgi:hypothetical protein
MQFSGYDARVIASGMRSGICRELSMIAEWIRRMQLGFPAPVYAHIGMAEIQLQKLLTFRKHSAADPSIDRDPAAVEDNLKRTLVRFLVVSSDPFIIIQHAQTRMPRRNVARTAAFRSLALPAATELI